MQWRYISTLLHTIPHVFAHGRIKNITTLSGISYTGWDPEMATNDKSPTPLAAWSASNLGNIYVMPSQFNTSDITCHYNATPGALHINTTAGDTLSLQWNEWPTSHVGPIMDYLASCNGSCAHADKRLLEWVKIDQMGWLNSSGWDKWGLGGTWATDVLIKNGFSWRVRIPDDLAEGYYVLRHEIIALHVANEMNGAQAYPQCVNLRVGKGERQNGTERRIEDGVVGSKLYGERDSGILVDVHTKMTGYEIPGPKVWGGATPAKQPNQKRQKKR